MHQQKLVPTLDTSASTGITISQHFFRFLSLVLIYPHHLLLRFFWNHLKTSYVTARLLRIIESMEILLLTVCNSLLQFLSMFHFYY